MDFLFTLSYKDPTGKHLQNFHYGNKEAKVWKGYVMPHRHTAKNMDFKPSTPPRWVLAKTTTVKQPHICLKHFLFPKSPSISLSDFIFDSSVRKEDIVNYNLHLCTSSFIDDKTQDHNGQGYVSWSRKKGSWHKSRSARFLTAPGCPETWIHLESSWSESHNIVPSWTVLLWVFRNLKPSKLLIFPIEPKQKARHDHRRHRELCSIFVEHTLHQLVCKMALSIIHLLV